MTGRASEIKLNLKTKIIQECGALGSLLEKMDRYEISSPGILVDHNLYRANEYVSSRVDSLAQESSAHIIMYDHSFEPSYQYLDKLTSTLVLSGKKREIDGWVGIGGGSVLDTAKGLAILSTNEGPSVDFRGFPTGLNRPLPVIAIPSTAGTGSEVVYNASFIDEEASVKLGINYEENHPCLALLDPLILEGTPLPVLASSGCDALVHTLEGFVSKKSNQITRTFSKKAFYLIMQNLPKLLNGEGDLATWANMQWAAVFAMLGLSNTSSGPAGALSYYLGTHYNVPHGVAGAIFIGHVSRCNHEAGYHDYAELYNWSENRDNELTESEKSQCVVEDIHQLLLAAEIPVGIKHIVKDKSGVEDMLSFAREAKAAFDFNPIPLGKAELEKIALN